jgi:hypothetical protein
MLFGRKSAMRKGLTGPPVNAPVLPENHFYYIRHRIGDMGPNYWEVQIKEKHRFFSYNVGRGTADYRGPEESAENLIRLACERAYDNMMEQKARREAMAKYEGDWSG